MPAIKRCAVYAVIRSHDFSGADGVIKSIAYPGKTVYEVLSLHRGMRREAARGEILTALIASVSARRQNG